MTTGFILNRGGILFDPFPLHLLRETMLIVNADDLGRDPAATNAALACHGQGRITSTSAMMFMADSERGAELALASGIDVGLHINLSERFTGGSVPARLQEHHGRVCRFLRASKYALLLYHPFLREQFRYACAAQHAEFLRLYGSAPSHLDGHQHMHLASNMLIGHLLPRGTKVRRSFSFRPGEKSFLNRLYGSLVDRCLARRHRVTDYFFSLAQHLAPGRLPRIIELAEGASVELMTHPANPEEYNFLMSAAYSEMTRNVEIGTYASLEPG